MIAPEAGINDFPCNRSAVEELEMDFGKVTDPGGIDFTLPPDDPANLKLGIKSAAAPGVVRIHVGCPVWQDDAMAARLCPKDTPKSRRLDLAPQTLVGSRTQRALFFRAHGSRASVRRPGGLSRREPQGSHGAALAGDPGEDQGRESMTVQASRYPFHTPRALQAPGRIWYTVASTIIPPGKILPL